MRTKNPDLYLGSIVRTRIRLARNLADYPFKIEDYALAREVVKKVNRALVRADTFNLYYVSNLTNTTLESMKERHLISQNLIDNRECGAVLINQDESVSVMINEEDHIRLQIIQKGFGLDKAYDIAEIFESYMTEEEIALYMDTAEGYFKGTVSQEELEVVKNSQRYKETKALLHSLRVAANVNDIYMIYFDEEEWNRE